MIKQSIRRLSCAETAQLVRKALRQAFPVVRFSVRSKTYSGGASIDIAWTDGPAAKEVDEVVKSFEGADFDGMIDLKTHNRHWLMPDGSIEIAEVGIGHSRASEHEHYAPSRFGAELVSFAADYIFTNRHYSVALLARIAADVCAKSGWDEPVVHDGEHGAYLGPCDYQRERAIWRAAGERSERATITPTPA